jgi:hypothetical protein
MSHGTNRSLLQRDLAFHSGRSRVSCASLTLFGFCLQRTGRGGAVGYVQIEQGGREREE